MNKRPKKSGTDRNAVKVFRDSNDQILGLLDRMEEEATESSGAKRAGKRQSYRDLECEIEIYHTGGVAPTACIVPTRDLSSNGICFLHRSYIHTGSAVTVNIKDREGKVHSVNGEIMRCRYVTGMVHEIGAKFNKSIALGDFCELDPLKLAVRFEDVSAGQIANHQFMCVGAEAELLESIDDIAAILTKSEFDALIYQGSDLNETVIQALRAKGFKRPILAIAEGDDADSLKDCADHVFTGPMTPALATEVVKHIRAAA